jgi:hypothetical protein
LTLVKVRPPDEPAAAVCDTASLRRVVTRGLYGSSDLEKMVIAIEKSLGVPECKEGAIKGKLGFSENG